MIYHMVAALRAVIRDEREVEGLTATFGGRVYLDEAPADSPLPLCVYELQTERLDRMMRGNDHVVRAVFRMACSADSSLTLYDAQQQLRTLLDGTTLKAEGYDRVFVKLRRLGVPIRDDDAWTVEDEYEMRGNLA